MNPRHYFTVGVISKTLLAATLVPALLAAAAPVGPVQLPQTSTRPNAPSSAARAIGEVVVATIDLSVSPTSPNAAITPGERTRVMVRAALPAAVRTPEGQVIVMALHDHDDKPTTPPLWCVTRSSDARGWSAPVPAPIESLPGDLGSRGRPALAITETGSLRAYFVATRPVPGAPAPSAPSTPGAPSDPGTGTQADQVVVLSATSRDAGASFTFDPGVRLTLAPGGPGAPAASTETSIALARSGERWTMLCSTPSGADVYASDDGLTFTPAGGSAVLPRRVAGDAWAGPWQGGLLSLDGRLHLAAFNDSRIWTTTSASAASGVNWSPARSIVGRGRWPALVLGPGAKTLLIFEAEPGDTPRKPTTINPPGQLPGPGPDQVPGDGPDIFPVQPSPRPGVPTSPSPRPSPEPEPAPDPKPMPRDPTRQPPGWTPK